MITDMVAKANMSNEMSEADLVFQVLMTCGKKVMAEMLPAAIPKSCIDVIIEGIIARTVIVFPKPLFCFHDANCCSSAWRQLQVQHGLAINSLFFNGISFWIVLPVRIICITINCCRVFFVGV